MQRAAAVLARMLPILWLGAGLAVSFVAIPVVFSPAIKAVLPQAQVGLVAQNILGRYFEVQLLLVVLSLLARWFSGNPWKTWERVVWSVLAAGSLTATGYLFPKMQQLYRTKYQLEQPTEVREAAAQQFRRWHGISQAGNLVLLLMLGAVAWKASATIESRPR